MKARVADFNLTDPDTIPVSAGANYEGFMELRVLQDILVGEMDLNVAFSPTGGSITGAASNFSDIGFQPVSGTLQIGTFDIGPPIDLIPTSDFYGTFAATVVGKLSGDLGDYDVVGAMIGGFADDGATPRAAVGGGVAGEVQVDGFLVTDISYGQFVAER
ncbi:MAG: hypothetical protein ABF248_07840 [Yoonia sp.]